MTINFEFFRAQNFFKLLCSSILNADCRSTKSFHIFKLFQHLLLNFLVPYCLHNLVITPDYISGFSLVYYIFILNSCSFTVSFFVNEFNKSSFTISGYFFLVMVFATMRIYIKIIFKFCFVATKKSKQES